MSNYKTELLAILDRQDIDVPVSANIFVYDKGKVIARCFSSDTGDWGRFVDRLYVTSEPKYSTGTVWLADGEVLELDDGVWTVRTAYSVAMAASDTIKDYRSRLAKLLAARESSHPVKANLRHYGNKSAGFSGLICCWSIDSSESWAEFTDSLPLNSYCYSTGSIWLSDGEVIKLDDGVLSVAIADFNRDLQKLDTAALSTWGYRKDLALSKDCVWTDDEKVAVIIVADALRVGDVPGLKQIAMLPSHCRTQIVLPKQRVVLPERDRVAEQYLEGRCFGPDPVAEANVLTLIRLIVSASGNMSEPPASMKDYWDASTIPTVRAAAQALLDFKAAVEF